MVLKDKKTESKAFLNENIPFSRVLLISEDGKEKQEITRLEALSQAKKSGLDLLCVAPSANPPVCKLVNYYQLSKKNKKPKKNICHEIKVSLRITDHDLNTKLTQIQKWIEKGDMVKFNLVLTGREKSQQELAREKCQRWIKKLQEQSPKISLMGNIRQHFNSIYFFLGRKK